MARRRGVAPYGQEKVPFSLYREHGIEKKGSCASIVRPFTMPNCQRKYYFRIRLDPNSACATPSRPYPRIIDLAGAISGSPTPLQLNRRGNAVIDGFVH